MINNLKQRIFGGWTIQRGIFLLMGTIVIIQSTIERQWAGIFFGAYFGLMGLLDFGCASGSCSTNSCAPKNVVAKEKEKLN